ncbi:MAG: hypothetical protein B0W54_13100 [Cellvibrio sp. 79]|nr:MAG: hypothetical protein B0W54_13100 [Cellvibrio sp. 79]
MTRSVFANTRNFSHKGSGDKSMCTAPDVCKTPVGSATPPIPYPVVSQVSDLAQATSSVIIDGNPTAIASSTHTKCSGDQAGSATGIISGTTGNKTQFSSYSFDVKAEGEGVVRHMDMTTMNNRNTMGINLGAATTVNELNLKPGEVESIYTLRFEFIDELGQPVHGLNYKTLPAGQKEDLDQGNGKSNVFGKTFVCSTEQNESIDCYLVWHKFSAGEQE